MTELLKYILAILPGLFVCYLFYRWDKYEKEQWLPLLICFTLGILITVPAYYLQEFADRQGVGVSTTVWESLFFAFIIIALSEEIFKFIALRMYPFSQPFFNEPFDGIVYAVFMSMGFATTENVLYAQLFGVDTVIVRALTTTPAHAIFGIVMGYFIGQAKFKSHDQAKILARGFILAWLLHGLYDFFIVQEIHELLLGFALIVILAGLLISVRLIKQHQDDSPFRFEDEVSVDKEP